MAITIDDRMDTDSNSSDQSDVPLDDIDQEILGLTSDAETYDDEDMDMGDYSSSSDNGSYSDDTELQTPSPPPTTAPSAEIKWHEGDPILRKIGLETLNDKGYVNLETICTDRTFGYSGNRALEAARWRAKHEVQIGLHHRVDEPLKGKSKKGKYGRLDDFHRIHPIFRQDNWNSDDLLLGSEKNHYFEKLKPVLQLATLLLEDETMVGYIFGMLDVGSHKEITFPGVEKRLGRKVYSFEKRNNLSEAERQTVWKELYELSANLWWTEEEISTDKEKLHAYTWGDRGSIEIVLDKHYIDCVSREVSAVEGAIDWTPGSDGESARLRVMFNLATTMVHEVMHALWRNKHFPDYEPYYMDTRAAELGFQWEQLLYSGQIDNPTQDRGSPYILTINNWPAPSDSESDQKVLMSHKKWGSSDVLQDFAVDMGFVQGLFTHEFWSEVDRYGISNFWPRRMLGIRSIIVSKYWDAESPTVRGPADGKPPSPDGADSRGIIDRH